MERARSVPVASNPFYSDRVKAECLLESTRPRGLPTGLDDSDMDPLQGSLSGVAEQSFQELPGQSGKGRGGSSAGEVALSGSVGRLGRELKTEGTMPRGDSEMKTMGRVMHSTGEGEPQKNDGDLQRALEGELVEFLRNQNSILMNELANLRDMVKKGQVGQTNSGMESSPWSAVDGVGSTDSSVGAGVGHTQNGRLGRNGSRTPRTSKHCEVAASPERKKEPQRFTPNGTRVPDGPPPAAAPVWPPVPPIPMVDGAQHVGDIELYDTCDSKPRVKNGDREWKPQSDRIDRTGVLSANEAKQFWLEQEVKSLRKALDRVAVPTAFHESGYWNGGFETKGSPQNHGHATVDPRTVLEPVLHRVPTAGSEDGSLLPRALHGGSGEDALQHRAVHGAPKVPGGVRAACVHGEHHDRDRAFQHGEHQCGGRALMEHDPPGGVRAFAEHGGLRDDARAFGLHGAVPGQARAPSMAEDPRRGLFDCGPGRSCELPRHDVGGGGVGDGKFFGRTYGPWSEGSGSMNTKGELPDLPSDSSPLQFGDWLHLITPIMKDISASAGWWWESTLREAKGFYEEWRRSSPLQRIQIQPRLPEDLQEAHFQRTEQRGIQMLLKAIPAQEQQALVTDRVLSSTAIIYKLLVRFQPGGAGEKQLLLSQLTRIPKAKDVTEAAAGIRNWRRHYGRAQEVEVALPDGVLLLKALDTPLQFLGNMDPQAAFRLSQSRMQLQLDQQPTHQNLWAFSQCLLAEAETLALLQTSSTSTVSTVPLKLKQLDGDMKSPAKLSNGDSKSKPSPMADKPCRYFVSDKGCKAGKSCKWQHDWESLADKSARCFVCGSKEHRKNDCKLRTKKPGEPMSSGGGSGQGRGGSENSTLSSTETSTMGGKAGAAAAKVLQGADSSTTTTSSSMASPGESKTGGGGDDNGKGSSDGGTGGDQIPKAGSKGGTEDLLHEATQLLKSLRLQPKINVMQLAGLDRAEDNWVLIDSGATHALRPAHDLQEWTNAERTVVQLATGETEAFRLKKGTKVLLGHPTQTTSRIVPMGGLTALDFTLQWSGDQCQLRDDEGREFEVRVVQGCPMVSLADGRRILEWLEWYQVHQQRKLAMVRTLLADDTQVDRQRLDLELALTYKLRQLFPHLPDEVMMRVAPHLEMVKTENFESNLPWNRHKRRRLRQAKHVIIHLFSGPDHNYWDQRCANANTEVLCIDTACSTPANLHDRNVFGYLLTLCASGRVRAILGGPPCRTVSALRYQNDDGPGVLRTEEHPYGLPTLSPADAELVIADSVLMFRFWSLLMVAEEMREETEPPTQFFMEQPEDPKRYRSEEDVRQHEYFSVFRTAEWKALAEKYNVVQYHFDQHPLGHPKRKPTCLATNVQEVRHLDGVRGAPSNEAEAGAQFRAMTFDRRCEVSRTWSQWALGLKNAISLAVSQRVQWLERHPDQPQQPAVRTLGSAALESWKTHYLHDHMPSRRDCQQCVRAQARARPHRRVQHPEAFTLSVDLSGKFTPGINQEQKQCKYLLVGVYTFPITRDGVPLASPDGVEPQDQPLPGLDEFSAEDGAEEGQDLLQEQEDGDVDVEGQGENEDQKAEKTAHGCLLAWQKLVEESMNVTVKNITFVETIESRNSQHVLPAIAKIYSRLRQLCLPVMRLHSDRAREFLAAPLRRWAQNRDIVLTKTAGDDYKANGRCEAELGVTKRAIRTVISAGRFNINLWPLVARHVGERRLRAQLRACGYPVGDLLKFGTQAFVLRKWWQDNHEEWGDTRQPVLVLGPDACSTLTSTNYFVQSIDTGKYFFTADVITPDFAATEAAVLGQNADQPAHEGAAPRPIGADNAIYLPERDEVSRPAGMDLQPARRLRGKTKPAMLHRLMRAPIEGEDDPFESLGRVNAPSWERESDDSWTLETIPSPDSSLDGSGGGEEEEAPNSQCGGSCLTASQEYESFLQKVQHNLHMLVMDEMAHIDGTADEQAWCMPVLKEMLVQKAEVEEELIMINRGKNEVLAGGNEFLVTRTVSNKEVWEDIQNWEPSVRAEYEQLVNQKQAVKQMKKSQLRQLAQERQLPIELLPAKMVHTRKANTGAYRSRAVVCGNYQDVGTEDRYAGGADGCQVRALIRTAALRGWCLAGSDIRVAFLNAPKRDTTKITAMEVPTIFKHLGLADAEDVWIIEKALYGLVSSPRDWGIHRDEVLPTLRWHRDIGGVVFEGRFVHSKDENLWRLVEVNQETGAENWAGLMSVYVDDILVAGETKTVKLAMEAIQSKWALSEVEWAADKPLRYCGFEVSMGAAGDGFYVSQSMYEQELLTRWGIEESLQYPAFKVTEEEEHFTGEIDPNDVRTAQLLTGALLWLSTRTRPDLVFGVSAMSRLTTKNPKKAVEIGYVLLKYLHGNPGGMHYPQTIPGGDWGRRDQLKARRHQKMLEVFSDISYAAGADHKSIQGLVVYYAGVPIAWQCGVQPFVAHSTAEAELIAYCESLVVGRATEALLASIWQQWDFEKVIYGDNAAAINLAHGVTTASWRTRHLRIRASVLKEALDETNRNRGGGWKLLHLKGTELVADGCTKPLQGQAFAQFVDDLGLRRTRRVHRPAQEERHAAGAEPHGAAMRAMVLGSLLLSRASGSAVDENDDEETNWVFTTGAVLMALGAIYSGQILFEVTKCCLRRLRSISTGEACNEDGALAMSEDEDSTLGGGAMRRSASSRSGSATNEGTTSMSSSSGSASSAGAMRLRSSTQSGSATRAGATRQASSSRSGLSMDSSSSGGGMRSLFQAGARHDRAVAALLVTMLFQAGARHDRAVAALLVTRLFQAGARHDRASAVHM